MTVANTFLKSLDKLGRQERVQVQQAYFEFFANPEAPGHRLHKLNCREERFVSISVNMDLRIIVLKDGRRVVFCYAGHHDDAYRWAERRRFEPHPVTGAAQMVEFEEVIREEVRTVPREVAAPPLFAEEEEDYLLSLGVPKAWLAAVKELDEDGLYAVLERLPEEAGEALIKLATGERPEPAPAGDLATDPFAHPDAQRRFWVVADEQALRQALDYPWEQWMVFLHPAQRNAVERNFGGPARVSGGAGTGKTVVAMHRAVHLARMSENAQVLLTTYSRPLVAHLERGLDRLAGASGDVRRRVRVDHLHRLAHQFAKQRPGFAFTPLRPAELQRFLKAAAAEHPDVDVSHEFLRAEFDAVIDYWGVKSWMEYREVQRTGRGSALSPARRKRLWPVFESVLWQMKESSRMTWSDLADAARAEVESRRDRPFRYVVVDEAQDFGPRELKFLMALAPASTRSHFFAGDVGQRIYRYPFPWIRAGVDIRGRGATLSVNYRTTRQIKGFADRALGEIEPSEGEEAGDRSALSLLSGPSPSVVGFETADQEVSALAEWLQALGQEGIDPGQIGLFARTREILEGRAATAVERAGLAGQALAGNDAPNGDAVVMGTLHHAKGLEFRAVGLVGCEAAVLPHPSALAAADDAEGQAVALARERQLLYVGCTRARDVLRISYTGMATRFLSSDNSLSGN